MTTTSHAKTKLREFLDARGVRYVWVAEQLGITRAHFHQVMEGNRPLTTANAARIAELFSVSPSAFQDSKPEATDGR